MSSIWETRNPDPRHFWIRLSIAAGLVLLVAAAYTAGQSSDQPRPSGSPGADSQPSLGGAWKLNRDESDDPREKLRSAIQDREQNGSPGGMGRHGGMGGGGMGGGIGMGIPGIGGGMGGGMGRPGGGQRGASGSDEQHARLRDLVQAPDQVSIVQKGPEIDLTDTENHVRALFTDGRKLEKPKKESTETQVKAHWDHETLVTEEKGPNGEKVSHSYEITNEGKQLADTLTLESKKLNTPIIIRSVYDKSE
jgi:hypothetical protein